MATPAKKPKANPDPYPPGWEPFLGAIRAHVDEDTPRVVFADWLEENGDPERAEFIRIQCDVARGKTEAAPRAEALLAANRKRWIRGFPKVLVDNPERCKFRRGFVYAVPLKGPQLVKEGAALARLTPLEELHLEQVNAQAIQLPALASVRALVMPQATSPLVEGLAKSPVIPTLRKLRLAPVWGARVSQRSVRSVIANPALTQLRELRLESMPVGDVVCSALAAAPHVNGLEVLELSRTEVTTVGAEALAKAPAAATLRVLSMDGYIGDAGLQHLVRSKHLRQLETLDLRWCQLTNASATLLAEWEGLRTVRKLDLRGNRTGPTARQIISGSPNAINLKELHVP
ncbi:MAG: TIGR02996 domain-containing protein [Planctomycetes bacterium]|nr:TIGR02996 domain-containing protein [Planctomycetota bacterium]